MSVVPDFVVAGYTRSGTTWLHDVLRQHPAIFLSERKELHYFDRSFGEGLAFYDRYLSARGRGQLAGDISPTYAELDGFAERFAAELPEAKLLILLRDPCERVVSVWRQLGRDGRFDGSLAQLLASEDGIYWRCHDYGRLFAEVREAGAQERLTVLFHDQLRADPDGFISELLHALGIDDPLPPFVDLAGARTNPTTTPKSARTHAQLQRINRWARNKQHPAIDRLANGASGAYRYLMRSEARSNEPTAAEHRNLIIDTYTPGLEEASEVVGIDLLRRWEWV